MNMLDEYPLSIIGCHSILTHAIGYLSIHTSQYTHSLDNTLNRH